MSTILARPPGSSSIRPDPTYELEAIIKEEDSIHLNLLPNYRLVTIIDRIVDQVYGEKTVSAEIAENLLRQLKRWSDGLPDGLKSLANSASGRNLEHIQCSLNVACAYYFALTLVTRPFLITTLTARMSRRTYDPGTSFQEDDIHDRLATVCVDSAMYLVRSCLEANRDGLLLGNMCIMK